MTFKTNIMRNWLISNLSIVMKFFETQKLFSKKFCTKLSEIAVKHCFLLLNWLVVSMLVETYNTGKIFQVFTSECAAKLLPICGVWCQPLNHITSFFMCINLSKAFWVIFCGRFRVICWLSRISAKLYWISVKENKRFGSWQVPYQIKTEFCFILETFWAA